MTEQDEAKTFHAAQAFTNTVFHYTMSAHAALRLKSGREQADAFYDALIKAIESARSVGRDETLASESPFTSVECEVLTMHAALYAFNQFSPMTTLEMKEFCNGALECANKVVSERVARGQDGKIDPQFHITKGDTGEVVMGVSLKEKATED